MSDPLGKISGQSPLPQHSFFTSLNQKGFVQQFLERPDLPISNLPSPEETVDFQHAKNQITSADVITLPKEVKNGKNKAIQKRVEEKSLDLLKFAKNHPFLTAGFILGIIFVLCSFPFIGLSFAHIGGLAMLHTKIGLSMGLAAFFYGIYLINLARRASIKDDLEAKLQAQKQLRESLIQDSSTLNVKKHIQEISAAAKGIETKTRERITTLKRQHTVIKASLTKSSEEEQFFQQSIQTLQNLMQSTHFSHLPSGLQENAKKCLKNAQIEFETGQVAIWDLVQEKKEGGWEIEEMPEPQFILPTLPAEIEIPKELSDTQKKNQLVKKTISQKMAQLVNSAQMLAKDNPGSVALMVVGIITTLIAIPALAYWLRGYQSIYIIGSLSLAGIFQFVIYGVSLIYEGHNSIIIKRLSEELEKIEASMKEQETAYRKIHEELTDFRSKAMKSVTEYQENWQTVLDSVQSALGNELRMHATIRNRPNIIRECQQSINEILMSVISIPHSLLPEPALQTQPLELLAQGATSFGELGHNP